MVWHIIRYWITFLLPTFYKRIQGKNVHYLNVKGPVIIAMNHPNAFTDPIAITAVSYPLRVKYMARGDVFKPGIVSFLLERIGIVPIFRARDGGKEGLKKNDEAYRRVNRLLAKNAKIIVFAEGLCIQERRLRPLKKGVSRMVFGAYESLNNQDLIVVPVGVNYSKPDKFRSTIFFNVGEPIKVKDFIDEYRVNSARANTRFLQVLEPKMKELITHVNNEQNDEVVFQIEEMCKKAMVKEQGLNDKNLQHDQIVLQQIVDLVNNANQNLLDEFKLKARSYLKKVRSHKLRDWLIDSKQNKNVNFLNLVLRTVLLLAGFPVYAIGMVGNFPPLIITHKMARGSIKNREFYSSIALGIGMVIFLINYLAWFFITYQFSLSIFQPIIICTVLMLCGWFCLHYHPFLLKTFGMARALKNKVLVNELLAEREKLLSLVNKF